MNTELVMISPTIAEDYLCKNQGNRPIRNNTVRAYAREMRNGTWMQTHQGIAFDAKGRLVDGQHRLEAIKLSGKTLPFLVTTGLVAAGNQKNLAAMDVIDCGKSRTTGDQLALLHGVRYGSQTAAICKQIVGCISGKKDLASNMSVARALVIMEHYGQNIPSMLTLATNFKPIMYCPLIAVCVIATGSHEKKAFEFMTALSTGENLKAGNPALVLRNFMAARPAREYQHTARQKTANAFWNFIKGIEQHSVRQGFSGIEWLMQENAEAMKTLARKLNLDL